MNEIVPSSGEPHLPEESGAVKIFRSLIEGGLPQIIAGPAGKAISRLIGGAADIPAAWLEARAQAIRDEKEARTTVIKQLSGSVADAARANPELTQRAMERWLGRELAKQQNIESVSSSAVEILQAEGEAGPAENDGQDVSEEWLSVFSDFAGHASQERVRKLWARVLAGEIRKSGAFSLKTLNFLSVMDQRTAEKFAEFAALSELGGRIFQFGDWSFSRGAQYSDAAFLEDEGLLNRGSANIFNPTKLTFRYKEFLIVWNREGAAEIQIEVLRMTRVGSELLKVIPYEINENYVKALFEHFKILSGDENKVTILKLPPEFLESEKRTKTVR